MRNGNERKSLSSSPLDWEVGLGLKMQLQQPTASYSCDGGGGGGGGGPFFNGSNNQPHIFELANGVLVQRNLDNAAASRASPGGGLMGVCGKALFTSSQLQELERQKMIYKYIVASIPVPPQLLLSTTPPPSSLSQSNTSGLDLRYSTSSSTSNGSDPEPWRCKRTDGKKWRCSRDVAPDLKYCERHAHKNRPRSRKHVEISLPTTHKPNSSLLIPPSSTLPRSSSSQFPYHQTRCIEWLMRGGSGGDDATNKQQWGQGQLNDDLSVNNVYRPHFADKQGFINSSNADTTQAAAAATATTRLFIDAWGKEGTSGQGSSSEKKLTWPSSSLSLSMGEGGGDEKVTDLGGIHQWLNPNCWMNSSSSSSSAPGGPLGEALCLGNGNYSTNLASPHAHSNHGYSYSYSNSNTNSSSKSSCEDASHALNFIG